MSSNNGFTPTEKRIMNVLRDGLPHTKSELKNAIDEECPDQVDDNALAAHIKRIREKLDPKCKGIMCIERPSTRYQLVRTDPPGYDDMTATGYDGTE